jgi:hypothetical protein
VVGRDAGPCPLPSRFFASVRRQGRVAEILVKAKALGPVSAAALAFLSGGESALVASIIRDVRRMAEFRAGGSDA